jgi:nicotinate dehydrogenase subunit A
MPDPIAITVNGAAHKVAAAPETPLLYVLRNDLELNGPKFGCGLAQCGACTAIVDGAAIRSCATAVSEVADREVTTIEGIGTSENPHPLQRAFIELQAAQCGYCINGMVMTAKALLDQTPHASNHEIREALAGNLCRCGTHIRILRAVEKAAKEMAS